MKKHILPLLAFAMYLTCSTHAQEAASTWQGSFLTDSGQHRAVLQIVTVEKGNPQKASLFIEFFPDWLDVNSVVVENSKVKIVLNGGRGVYEGKMNAEGTSIEGVWTYDRHTAALSLQRTTQEAAWHVPFPYRHQYHYKDINIARPSPSEPVIPFSPRLAVDYLEQGALAWSEERECVACHTNGSYMVVRPLMTQQLGPPQKELRDFFVRTLREQLAGDPDDPKWQPATTQIIYIAAGLAIWDAHVTHRLSPETTQALSLLFKLQRAAGDWDMDDETNPPLESSHYQLATVVARAVGNAPGWLDQQRGTPVEAQVNLLKDYLRAEKKLQADYDRTDLLWAASEFPGLLNAERTQQLIAMIFKHQRSDGGWSIRTFALPEEWGIGNRAAKLRAEPEYENTPSDGHMTGLAIIALRRAGIPASDVRMQRGVAWLLSNQRSSGRWWTRSLIGDNWQFMSYSGTAYPLLALSLCDALPASSKGSGVQLSNQTHIPRQDGQMAIAARGH